MFEVVSDGKSISILCLKGLVRISLVKQQPDDANGRLEAGVGVELAGLSSLEKLAKFVLVLVVVEIEVATSDGVYEGSKLFGAFCY